MSKDIIAYNSNKEMQFIKIEELSAENIKFSSVKSQRGRRFINAYYNKKNISIKLPTMKVPFNTRMNQYSQLEVSVNLGQNEELKESIKNIDNFIKKSCVEEEWYDNNSTPSYTPMLKESANYSPTLKFKIPLDDNKNVKTKFFDKERVKIDIKTAEDVSEILKRNTRIQIAAECVGVWFMDNRYGLSWKASQIRIVSDSSESEKEKEEYSFYSSDGSSDISLLISDDEE